MIVKRICRLFSTFFAWVCVFLFVSPGDHLITLVFESVSSLVPVTLLFSPRTLSGIFGLINFVMGFRRVASSFSLPSPTLARKVLVAEG